MTVEAGTGRTGRAGPRAVPAPRSWSATSVRARIAATIAVVSAAAMGSAGVVVYLLESARIERSVEQSIAQEAAELRQLREGTDPTTGRPFASAEAVLELYLERNVSDDNELLVAYVDGQVPQVGPSAAGRGVLDQPVYRSATATLLRTGGTRRLDIPTYQEVWVTAVRVPQVDRPQARDALVIVNFVDADRRELQGTMQTYAAVTAAFLVLITLIALWRASTLLAPLTSLRRTAQDIGETDLALRIPERGNDEISALTRTLNDMLGRLEGSFVDQRRFLDDAGHELRTPLTVLRGHLELLDVGDTADVVATRDLLLEEVDRMSRLVGDLILLAKSDRPDFVARRPVDAARLLRTLQSKARGVADRDWRSDEVADAVVPLDEQRVTQAVLQLVENAVKHTRPGDVVALGSRLTTEHLELWVRDSGPGVDAADRERIFERFARSTVVAHDEGFGLGLSIVAAIAAAHGGHARLDPPASPATTSPTDVARFVVALPRGR